MRKTLMVKKVNNLSELTGEPQVQTTSDNTDVVDQDGNVLEVDNSENTEVNEDNSSISSIDVNSEEYQNSIFIEAIEPMDIDIAVDTNSGAKIAILSWLARMKDGSLLILVSHYMIESEAEELYVQSLPFFSGNMFSGSKLAFDFVAGRLAQLITDWEFTKVEDNKFSINAAAISKEDNNSKLFTFYTNTKNYSSIKFIDNYVFQCIVNNHEVSIAALEAGIVEEDVVDIVNVNDIKSIVAMAPAEYKKSSNVVLEIEVEDSNESKDTYKILLISNIGTVYPNKKFKGMNVNRLNSSFLNEENEYIQLFQFNDVYRIIDAEYMIVKGKNKDKKSKLFVFSPIIKNKLVELIKAY
jgi:hypothetical protein